jgi:hypothetical protein
MTSTFETIASSEVVEFSVKGHKQTLSFEVERVAGRREWTVRASRGNGVVFVGYLAEVEGTLRFFWAGRLMASHEAVIASSYVFSHMAQLEAKGLVKVSLVSADDAEAICESMNRQWRGRYAA